MYLEMTESEATEKLKEIEIKYNISSEDISELKECFRLIKRYEDRRRMAEL